MTRILNNAHLKWIAIIAAIIALSAVTVACWQPTDAELTDDGLVTRAPSRISFDGQTADVSDLYVRDYGFLGEETHYIALFLVTEDFSDGTGAYIELHFEHDGEVTGDTVAELVANANWVFYYAQALANFGQYEAGFYEVYETDLLPKEGVTISYADGTFVVTGTVDTDRKTGTPAVVVVDFSFTGPKSGTYNEIEWP